MKSENINLDAIGAALIKSGQTISVAESVTGGYLQYIISTITNAEKFWQGGITAYNIAQKYKHLLIEPIHALEVNCVSPQVATEMALHVCTLFNSHWGIGITGYASPVPEAGQKIFAYYAIAHHKKIMAKGRINLPKNNADNAQQHFANMVIKKLASLMKV